MTLEQIIQEALPMAEKWAPSQVAGLRKSEEELHKASLKITFLGDFKAGKSTLLNRLFIGKQLLPTAVAESTAVPTLLRTGEPCLQLMKREADGRERVVETLTNITPEILAEYLTAPDEAKRLELSQRYTHAVLSLPNILPPDCCLVDTPGLNTTNVGIMANSLWEAHDADAVVYVVRAKQLSRREAELIEEISGSQRSKIPFFVVLTTDGSQSDGQLENICQEIRAELSMRNIPCECGVFRLKAQHEPCRSPQDLLKQLGDAKKMARRLLPHPQQLGGLVCPTSWPLLLFEPPYGEEPGAPFDDNELRADLLNFIGNAVEGGHHAKIARELLPLLCTLQFALRYRLTLGAADAEKLAQAELALRHKETEYRRTVSNLLGDIRAAQINFTQRACDSVLKVKSALVHELESKQEVSAILQEMVSWKDKLPREITREVEREAITLEKDIRLLRDKYQVDLKQQMQDAAGFAPEYDAGLLGKIPAWLLTVLDYLLFDAISPLPMMADMLIRYLISGTRIEKWMPVQLACNIARSIASQKADELASQVMDNIRARMEMNFAELNTKLNAELNGTSPFAGEEDALEQARTSLLTEDDKQKLSVLAARLETMKAEL